jgi:hypothetical protein
LTDDVVGKEEEAIDQLVHGAVRWLYQVRRQLLAERSTARQLGLDAGQIGQFGKKLLRVGA